MKKNQDPDIMKATTAAAILTEAEAERDLREAELEERIIALEEQLARGKSRSNGQRSARQKAINQRKVAVAERKKAANARGTAIFFIMLFQFLVYMGLLIYVMTKY